MRTRLDLLLSSGQPQSDPIPGCQPRSGQNSPEQETHTRRTRNRQGNKHTDTLIHATASLGVPTVFLAMGIQRACCRFTHVQLFATPWTGWLLHLWDSPGKKTGVGCHFLLQGIFLTEGSSSGLPHLQADSLPAEPPGKPSPGRKVEKTQTSGNTPHTHGLTRRHQYCPK